MDNFILRTEGDDVSCAGCFILLLGFGSGLKLWANIVVFAVGFGCGLLPWASILSAVGSYFWALLWASNTTTYLFVFIGLITLGRKINWIAF